MLTAEEAGPAGPTLDEGCLSENGFIAHVGVDHVMVSAY